MKKRLLLKLGLVALLGTGLFVAWLWWTEPRTGICRYTANQIKEGMTETEVLRLIGSLPMLKMTDASGSVLATNLSYECWWHENNSTLIVSLDREKQVRHVDWRGDNLLAKLRRWLHLE